MQRTVTISADSANSAKKNKLDVLFEESKRVVNLYVADLWQAKNFNSKFVDTKVATWFSARLQQCLGKQALQIVKSQRRKKKKTMPVFTKEVIELDERFTDIRFDENSFDIWIKLTSLGNKLNIKLPSKKHKHLNKYLLTGWLLKKSIRLRKFEGRYFIDLYFEKPEPAKKADGDAVGCDIGYKKLLVFSDGSKSNTDFTKIYEKISRKKQGSKQFRRTLKERDNLINREINTLNLQGVRSLVVEDLKNVKHKSKFSKKFNNLCQRWSYPKVLDKTGRFCEESGIELIKVPPAYTSQICSVCGFQHRDNRKGDKFMCGKCGVKMDADYNASINILHRGVYSPPAINIKETCNV